MRNDPTAPNVPNLPGDFVRLLRPFCFFGNNDWIEAYFLLPVLLLATEILIAERARAAFGITVASVASTILVGMSEVALFVGSYAAYRLILDADHQLGRSKRLAYLTGRDRILSVLQGKGVENSILIPFPWRTP